MERRLRAVVRGYVQGVGYRLFAMTEAQRLGLTGWVRNLPEGSVEVTVQGGEERLGELLSRLQRGPAEAEVEHVDVEWLPASGTFEGFEIRS